MVSWWVPSSTGRLAGIIHQRAWLALGWRGYGPCVNQRRVRIELGVARAVDTKLKRLVGGGSLVHLVVDGDASRVGLPLPRASATGGVAARRAQDQSRLEAFEKGNGTHRALRRTGRREDVARASMHHAMRDSKPFHIIASGSTAASP